MRSILMLAGLLASPVTFAANCTIDLVGNDQMKFDKTSVTVSSNCAEIEIKLAHSGTLAANVMGHNVVVSPTDVWQAAAQDGLKAGAANHYVTPGDARVIAYTEMIGGGQTTSVKFPGSALTAGTPYTFYCSFPGHWSLMKGDIVVE